MNRSRLSSFWSNQINFFDEKASLQIFKPIRLSIQEWLCWKKSRYLFSGSRKQLLFLKELLRLKIKKKQVSTRTEKISVKDEIKKNWNQSCIDKNNEAE